MCTEGIAKKVIVHEHEINCKVNTKIIFPVFFKVSNIYTGN